MALTKALREERDTLAGQEGNLRWSWGDWAIKVAGSPGEDRANDGSQVKLTEAREDGTHSDLTMLVPSVDRLSQYRIAAAAIPPKLRTVVRSVEAGRMLAQHAKDVGDRHRLIEALKNDKGVVTIDAIRAHVDQVSTHGDQPEPEPVQKAKAKAGKTTAEKEAAQRIKDAKVKASTAAAEGQTLSAHFWRIIGKVDEWRRDLAVIRESLATLSGDEKERVAVTYRMLRDELNDGLAVLEDAPPADPETLDGTAVEVGDLALTA